MLNESASTYAWLSRLAGLGQQDSQIERLWLEISQEMSSRKPVITYAQDWLSDFWLTRGTHVTPLALTPAWDPPTSLTGWQTGGTRMAAATGLPSSVTNHQSFLDVLNQPLTPEATYDAEALPEFCRWKEEIAAQADTRMRQVEHVRAWIGTSVGHLLMGIVLSPPHPALMPETARRLQLPSQYELPNTWVNEFEERRLEFLYNWRITPEGNVHQSSIRVGQGEEWREHWAWLSEDLDHASMLAAVQLAARLMRGPILADILIAALKSPNRYLQTVSLAVLRRWLLALQVMSWLETALQHPWNDVRPPDLACFAFNALKPEWPRRLMGISHRSRDVKPALMQLDLWQNGRCAIDARYVPSWETNTGMMWGLFAIPTLIARVDSPTYRDSLWCRREIELIDYLIHHGDHLPDRAVLDVPLTRLADLQAVIPAWAQQAQEEAPSTSPLASLISFPPMCQVWSPSPMPSWESTILRAAGALRMVGVFLNSPVLANRLADFIPPQMDELSPAPTNHPGGWQSYTAIFNALRALLQSPPTELPLHLPPDYSPEDLAQDIALSQRIPDLSFGTPLLEDILLAFEWLRTEWPIMVDQNRGNFLLINCQGYTREQWINAPELSLHRGLAAIRFPGPVWFLQSARQDVEHWLSVGQRPIFTEHVPNQFNWLMEISMPTPDQASRYPTDSHLLLSPELAQFCT